MGITIFDDDGEAVELYDDEASTLWTLTDGLEAATVSACPDCRSRTLAGVALVDLLADAPAFTRVGDLVGLADDAPTLHLYARDSVDCAHKRWRDPGAEEWREAVADLKGQPRAAS